VTPSLEVAYAEPHRRYHTRRHIEQCLALLDEVPDLMDSERQVLTYAIWWHDAVYDPLAKDNESRSADMARLDLRDFDVSIHAREEVARLIRLTAGHEVEEDEAAREAVHEEHEGGAAADAKEDDGDGRDLARVEHRLGGGRGGARHDGDGRHRDGHGVARALRDERRE
jgi:hypothetical protein